MEGEKMKYSGRLGFVLTEQTSPGTWTPRTEIRQVTGDVVQRTIRENDTQSINPDVIFDQQISFLYDTFMTQNMFVLEWIEWAGKKWKISKIDIRPPRMIVTIGKEWIEEGDDDKAES